MGEFILFRICKLLERIKRCTAVIFGSFHPGKEQETTNVHDQKGSGTLEKLQLYVARQGGPGWGRSN